MNKNAKIFVTFTTVALFVLLLHPAIRAQETLPRRNTVVIAVEKAGKAVANLSTEKMLVKKRVDPFFDFRYDFFDQFFDQFFGQYAGKRVKQPLDSGVIIDEDGYIITNEHVISRATLINVMLDDGSGFNATVVSSDLIEDLAILKIDSPAPLPFVKLGTSKDFYSQAPRPWMVKRWGINNRNEIDSPAGIEAGFVLVRVGQYRI